MKKPSTAFLVAAGILLPVLFGAASYAVYEGYRTRQCREIYWQTGLLVGARDLQELERFVDTLSSSGQRCAIGALSKRSYAPAKHIVVARAHSDDPLLRVSVLMYILELNLAEYKHIALSSLDDSSADVRKIALTTVCALKCSEARRRVTEMTEHDPDSDLRSAARSALGMLPPPGKASAPNPADRTDAEDRGL